MERRRDNARMPTWGGHTQSPSRVSAFGFSISPERRGRGRFFSPAGLKSHYAGEWLPCRRHLDLSTGSVIVPLVSEHTRICANPAKVLLASRQNDRFPNGIRRRTPQGVLSPVFQDQGDGFRQVLSAFLDGLPLSVRAGDLRAVSDIPFPVPFDNAGEFVAHFRIHFRSKIRKRLRLFRYMK